MMESFEAAHMEERALLQEELERDPARGGGAASRDAGAERDRQGEPITWVGLQPPCDSRPGLTVLAGPLFPALGHDHCP